MTHATHAESARGADALPEPQVAPLVHAVATTPLPTQPGSDEYDDAQYSEVSMMRAHVLRLASDQITSHYALELALDGVAGDAFGFEETPSHTTLSRAWRQRFGDVTKRNIESLADSLNHISSELDLGNHHRIEPEWPDEDLPGVPEVERHEKDRAYRRVAPILHDVVEFDRAPNSSVPADTLVDFASYLSRRGTFPEQGIDRWRAEEAHDPENQFCSETFRRAVRNVERPKTRTREGETRWPDPQDWSVNLHDPDGWHKMLEDGVDRLVDQLEDAGALDEPVPVNIDGSIRNYHSHPEGADKSPVGVYQESHFDTNYGWKDISATAIINGRSFVLANVSMVPGDRTFQAVKYLIDRAKELVDVECFYADAAFGTVKLCRYLKHVNEEFVIKKSHSDPVTDWLDDVSGKAGYTDYTMRTATSKAGGIREVDVTMFAVEKRGQIGVKKGETRSEEHDQSGLDDFDLTRPGQRKLDDYEEDVELVAFITNKEIDSIGIDPEKNPVAHDPEGTVWGCAQGYRRRWAIETAFRQVKHQFTATTTSRDLGVRRFFWALGMLLFNAWAVMNLLVQEWVPDAPDDRPPVRAQVFLEVLAKRRPPPD